LYLGGYSYHFSQPSKEFGDKLDHYNETNHLIGLGVDHFNVLVYKNSYYKTSVALLGNIKIQMSNYVDVLGIAGVATGYEDSKNMYHWGEVSPVFYAGFDIHPIINRCGILLTGLPGGFISLNFRVTIK
jgi:hypothetical protein